MKIEKAPQGRQQAATKQKTELAYYHLHGGDLAVAALLAPFAILFILTFVFEVLPNAPLVSEIIVFGLIISFFTLVPIFAFLGSQSRYYVLPDGIKKVPLLGKEKFYSYNEHLFLCNLQQQAQRLRGGKHRYHLLQIRSRQQGHVIMQIQCKCGPAIYSAFAGDVLEKSAKAGMPSVLIDNGEIYAKSK